MHIPFTLTIGRNLLNASLPAGETRGVAIDNPCGSWLVLDATGDYIPPYTLGWARSLDNAVASVTIRFVTGPAGQLSTQTGDAPTVTLYSTPVANSAGYADPGHPFVTRGNQPERAYATGTFSMLGLGGGSATTALLAASLVKRLRVYSVLWIVDATAPANRLDDQVRIITQEVVTPPGPTGIVVADDYMHGNRQKSERIYTDALDLRLGSEVSFAWFAPAVYAVNTTLQYELQYSVI